MSDMLIEIRVISDDKAANKTIINDLDAVLLKAWPTIEKDIQIEFKNIRTRTRQPKYTPNSAEGIASSNEEPETSDSEGS